ncbi:MAG: hypothetical protein ACLGSA_09210 [Acidobacteriota bacterium]
MKWLMTALLFLLAASVPCHAQADPHVFTVQSDENLEFARELCLAALAAAGVEARFSLFPMAHPKRLNAELASGNLSLAFLPPDEDSSALENQGYVKPLKVPLDRGLLGYRICLVRDEDADLLQNVRNADDLKRIRIGQGASWGDIKVYQEAGIEVVEAPFSSVSDPMKALASRYYDALPLGVDEYRFFLQSYHKEAPGITADRHIAISYPWNRYVWISTVAKDSKLLQESLDKGFEIIAANGQFEAIYAKFKDAEPRKQLMGRRIIRLQNAHSTPEDVDPRFRHLIIQAPG